MDKKLKDWQRASTWKNMERVEKNDKSKQPPTHWQTQPTPNLKCFMWRMLTSSPAISITRTQSQKTLLWQQSPAGWHKSQRYCLSKTTIRAVLSEALLYQKACGFPIQLKAFGQRTVVFLTLHQTHRSFSVDDNDRIHLRWPCCERFQGSRLCDVLWILQVCICMTKLHSV